MEGLLAYSDDDVVLLSEGDDDGSSTDTTCSTSYSTSSTDGDVDDTPAGSPLYYHATGPLEGDVPASRAHGSRPPSRDLSDRLGGSSGDDGDHHPRSRHRHAEELRLRSPCGHPLSSNLIYSAAELLEMQGGGGGGGGGGHGGDVSVRGGGGGGGPSGAHTHRAKRRPSKPKRRKGRKRSKDGSRKVPPPRLVAGKKGNVSIKVVSHSGGKVKRPTVMATFRRVPKSDDEKRGIGFSKRKVLVDTGATRTAITTDMAVNILKLKSQGSTNVTTGDGVTSQRLLVHTSIEVGGTVAYVWATVRPPTALKHCILGIDWVGTTRPDFQYTEKKKKKNSSRSLKLPLTSGNGCPQTKRKVGSGGAGKTGPPRKPVSPTDAGAMPAMRRRATCQF